MEPWNLETLIQNGRVIRPVPAISLAYDVTAGACLLFFPQALPTWFAIAIPEPRIFLQLNALFLIAIGLGYALPYRDPVQYRAYLWVFGVGLKSAGAAAFLVDLAWGQGPEAMALFAAGDGAMALLSLIALGRDEVPGFRGS